MAEEFLFLKPPSLSANVLALALRLPPNASLESSSGERAVTADSALRLARYFGTTPKLWITEQAGA